MNYFLHEFGNSLHEIGIFAYNLRSFSNYMYYHIKMKYIFCAFDNFCYKIDILHEFFEVH